MCQGLPGEFRRRNIDRRTVISTFEVQWFAIVAESFSLPCASWYGSVRLSSQLPPERLLNKFSELALLGKFGGVRLREVGVAVAAHLPVCA